MAVELHRNARRFMTIFILSLGALATSVSGQTFRSLTPREFSNWVAIIESGNAAPGTATLAVENGSFTVAGRGTEPAISVGTPLLVDTGEAAEIVIPTWTNCHANSSECQFTAVFAHAHPGRVNVISATAGFQEAMNALAGSGTTSVDVPPGHYVINATLRAPPSMRLNCANRRETAIVWSTSVTGAGIDVSAGDIIEHCDLVGPGTASSVMGVNGGYDTWSPSAPYRAGATVVPTLSGGQENGRYYVEMATSCVSSAQEPSAANMPANPWPAISGATVADGTCAWRDAGSTRVTLEDDTLEGWGGDEVNTGGYNDGWLIEACEFRNGGNEGVLAGGGSQHMVIQGNTFHDLASNAIDFGGGRYNLASHNVIRNVGQNSALGVDTDGIQMAAIPGFDAIGNRAIGNYIENVGQTGIRFRGFNGQIAEDETAADNTIIRPKLDCITWDDSAITEAGTFLKNDSAIGNRCLTPGRDGYLLSATQPNDDSDPSIVDNSSSGVNAPSYDLLIGSSTSNAIVSGNHFFSQSAGTPVLDQGSGTAMTSNQAGAGTPLPEELHGVERLEELGNAGGAGGADWVWADSGSHRLKFDDNNQGDLFVVGLEAAGASGNAVELAANGYDLADAGAPPALANQLPISATLNAWGPGVIAAGTCASTSVAVAGATPGMAVVVTPASGEAIGLAIEGSFISAADTVTVELCNRAAAAITANPQNYYIRILR